MHNVEWYNFCRATLRKILVWDAYTPMSSLIDKAQRKVIEGSEFGPLNIYETEKIIKLKFYSRASATFSTVLLTRSEERASLKLCSKSLTTSSISGLPITPALDATSDLIVSGLGADIGDGSWPSCTGERSDP